MDIILSILWILWILFRFSWKRLRCCLFTKFTYIPSKSNHWIRRATLAGCKIASLLRQGTPCPQGTWSERGGITSVLDCKNCDERRENWTGMTGVVRSPMVDYLRSLRQNPDGCIYCIDLQEGAKPIHYPLGFKKAPFGRSWCVFIQHIFKCIFCTKYCTVCQVFFLSSTILRVAPSIFIS